MQNALVLLIILLAAIYVGRRIYRSFSSKNQGCSCSPDCNDCDLKKKQ